MTPDKERLLKALAYFWNLKPSEWRPSTFSHLVEFLRLLDLFLNGAHTVTQPMSKYEPPMAKPAVKDGATPTGIAGVSLEQAKKIFGT